MISKKYKRSSSNTTVSIFCEQDASNKYNYDPPYQRDYNVWDREQKSLLIDSIMKNFPMPPIFLQQIIEKGKTHYDVIDGKQRLNTIREFVNNNIPLPKDFGNDGYGIKEMNGLYFSQIEKLSEQNEEVENFIDAFWSYTISIEYIERTDDENIVVDKIFDRLNRGGERLNPAELRKANFYDSWLYKKIVEVSKKNVVAKALKDMPSKRMKNVEFITEIFMMGLENKNVSGESDKIDALFEYYVENASKDRVDEVADNIIKAFELFDKLNLDLIKYSIKGASHLYALLYLTYSMHMQDIIVDNEFIKKINNFYIEVRSKKNVKNEYCQAYSESMQAQTKSKSARNKRVKAICAYMGVKLLYEI